MSTAPDLARVDGLTSFERAIRQPMMLGLFLPHQEGAWTPSKTPRTTSWQFEYNARLAVRADEAGVDGVQLNFFDFEPDLKYFTEAVLPLMQQSGLHQPVAALTRKV